MKFKIGESGGTLEFKIKYDDETGLPEKLGDGNFGMVFSAQSELAELAVKIIYRHQVDEDNIELQKHEKTGSAIHHRTTRVMDELGVTQDIAKSLREQAEYNETAKNLLNSYQDHLVLPLAYTSDIQHNDVISEASERKKFKHALEVMEERDIRFSKFAYVMPQFECSLKDLVEATEESDASVGYFRLMKSSHSYRERSALHVIHGVANGLKVLHVAGLRHQDIKPANIYYRSVAGSVDFRLGDLGFLRPQNPVLAGSAMVSTSELAIGTKHYRSVEQIDYSDTSEVKIIVDPNASSAVLVSHDPKFLRTNIHVGDLAFFPRSSTQRLFRINDINFDVDKFTTRVTISLPANNEKNAGVSAVFEDPNTQVSFVKNPTSKTDLFGLGAILFDVLTAGDSPERFYELLRKFDIQDASIDESILTYYSLWQAGQYIHPDVSAIFHRICGDTQSNSFSEKVIGFLLRCCMSEPIDSYYNEYTFERDNGAIANGWTDVISELNSLIDETGAREHENCEINCLTGKETVNPPSRKGSSSLLNQLPSFVSARTSDSRENESEQSDTGNYLLLRRVITIRHLADRAIIILNEVNRNEDVQYISFSPEHLNFSEDYSNIVNSSTFGRLGKLELFEKLKKLDVHLCSLTPYRDRLKPIWWMNRRRNIKVLQNNSGSTFGFEYMDFSPAWLGVAKGDYLIFGRGSNHAVFTVREVVDDNNLVCDPSQHDDAVEIDWGEDESMEGYLVKKLDQVDYIAGMLSIYIFQFMFYQPEKSSVSDFGPVVYSKIASYPCHDLELPVSDGASKGDNDFVDMIGGMLKKTYANSPGNSTSIQEITIRLSVWLMLGGYYSGGTSNLNRIEAISSQISLWFEKFATSVGEDGRTLSLMSIDPSNSLNIKQSEDMETVLSSFHLKQVEWNAKCADYIK